MKTLTIAIPVYNTEKYIVNCVDSLILPEIIDDIEIILVNDGSKDNSIKIINKYKEKYPKSITVIDKKNGGHGSTINVALKVAKGKFFRVIDSDDWVDSKNFIEFVNRLKNENVDLVVTDYRQEHIYSRTSKQINWRKLNDNEIYEFNDCNLEILEKEYFVMANSTYKTDILRKSNLELLEHTFYVDMQYNIIPILKIKTFKFMKLDIYRYYIGRPEQSMNLENFVKNRADHEKVMKYLIDFYNKKLELFSKNQEKYIKQILFYMLTTNYYIYCVYAKKEKRRICKEIRKFDKYLKEANIELYKMMDEIGIIRYNRKTRFLFLNISPKMFSKVINFFGKIRK